MGEWMIGLLIHKNHGDINKILEDSNELCSNH